jgi:hypothetical protein
MIGRILFGLCSFSTFIVMLMVMVFFRSLPKLMRLFLEILRRVFYLSYLLYAAVLSWINNHSQYQTGICLLDKPQRVILCGLLSVLVYGLVCLFRSKAISFWIIGCFLLHGLLVGFLWKDFFEPEGLSIGEKLW